MVIYKAAKYIQYDGTSGRDIHINTDSKAAIRSLDNVFIISRIVQ